MIRWSGLLACLSCALAVHNLLLGSAPKAEAGLFALLLMALTLEARGVAMPGFGRFSAGQAALVAVALMRGGGASASTLAVFACALSWAPGVLKRNPRMLPAEILASSFPVLAAAAAIDLCRRCFPGQEAINLLLPWIVGPAAQLVFCLSAPSKLRPPLVGGEKLAYTRVQRSLHWLNCTASLSALPLAWAAQQAQGPLGALALLTFLPLLLGLHRAAENEVFRVHSALAFESRTALVKAQEVLLQVHREKDRAQAELLATERERRGLEAFTRLLTEQLDLSSLGALIFDTLARTVPATSLVIFESSPLGLSPVLFRSPHSAILESAALLNRNEVLAQAALQRSQPALRSKGDPELLVGEHAAIAVPLGPRHVVYLGRPQPDLEDFEMRWAVWVCARASAALAAIEGQLQQKQELQQQSAARAALQDQVGWLRALLDLSSQLASTVDAATIYQRTQAALLAIVPHEAEIFCSAALEVQWSWGELPAPWLLCARQAAELVAQYGKPLLIPQVAASKFQAPGAPTSLLALPVFSESQGVSGAVLLLSREPDRFSRDHQDLLSVIIAQGAVALSKAALFRALQDSQAQVVQTSKLMAVGQLAAGVAHELNTPLGAISLMLEGAQGQLLKNPENAARKLERAHSALGRAKNIVHKLLVYSRKSEPDFEVVHPFEVIREAVDFLEPQLSKQGVAIAVEPEPADLRSMRGKSQELQQILINLLMNGAEACDGQPPERKSLWVGCRQTESDVQLWVEDRGEGIGPEVMARIFEPFFTTRPVGKGTGLGLSISQQIAHQHGGRLEVQSNLGQGSRFTLWLPVDR